MHRARAVVLGLVLGMSLMGAVAQRPAAQPGSERTPDSTGALHITARDSVTGVPLESMSVFVLGRRMGGMTDEKGVLVLGGLPIGTSVLKSISIAYHERLDTVVVRRSMCDSIVVRLKRWNHIECDGDDCSVWD